MEIICRGMRGGKTVEAIRRAAENSYTIVCYNANEVKRAQRLAEELGHKIPQPITFENFRNGSTISIGTSGYVIDNSSYEIEVTYFDEATRWDPKQYAAVFKGEW